MPSFTKLISITARCANQFRSERLSGIGINGIQYTYILNIVRNPGIPQEALGKLIYINKSNVTRQVGALIEAGFITREKSERDKRVLLLYPTEKARAAYPVIISALHEWRDYLTEGFTDSEMEQLSDMLGRVCEKAKKYVEEGSAAGNDL